MGYNSPMNDLRHTIKVPPDVHRLLRQIAAATGEKQYAVLHRLLAQEWSRLERQRTKG